MGLFLILNLDVNDKKCFVNDLVNALRLTNKFQNSYL